MGEQIKSKNMKKKANNLRSYLSKPANIITMIFFVLLLLTVCFPLLSLVRDSLIVHPGEVRDAGAKAGTYTLYHWKTLLAEKMFNYSRVTFWRPLLNSIVMALVSCFIAVGFGGAVAWLITRSNIPGKKFLSTIFVFPYIMPSWSIAMFWENFFKNSRIVACYNQVGMLESLTGICVPEWMLYGFFPCAMCLGIHYAPFAYLLIGGILRNMDANLEEAATVLKASRFKILRRVTLPIVMPALISTVLLVFSSSLSSFTVPSFLNKNGSFATVSTTMRSLFNSSSMQGQGFVIAIILLLFSVVILTLNNRFTGKRKSFTTVSGKSGQVSLVKLGKARMPIAIIVMTIAVFFAIVPLVSFALESFLEVPGDYSTFTLYYWTTHDTLEDRVFGSSQGILVNPTIWKAMLGSVVLSIVVAFISGTSGIMIGYAAARKRGSRLARWVSNMAFFPYLIPAMSFGAVYLSVSYTKTFSFLRGSIWLLILVGGIKFLPFASKSGANSMMQLSPEIEEAATIMRVSWGKRMIRILFPIQKASFISGYLLPFISCMRELSLFVLIAAPGSIITRVLQDFDVNGLTQISNGINFLIIVIVLLVQFITNKLTGASIDKGIGG
ncbi:MAG: iron ABC transporter permease [Candidatus Ornithospirochaeta sp.]|nr:iron ABC transporter permease [Candidatus Ornithospirochaeta sp.]